jgi:peptidoglycan hydrolase-like protein with peptidoglycan-binding domain
VSALGEWRAAGKPVNIAQPIVELASTLRRRGYTVGTIGNDAHLQASVPEDHTPFSATGWPVPSPRWWVHACDIMPDGPVDLGRLAAQLVADRDAGQAPWIKYVNVSLPGHSCQHISWQPTKRETPSSDVGHIHLSIRSDWTHKSINGYDPVARLGGGGATPATQPAWPGTYLKVGVTGHGTATWQQRMRQRGWAITVDDAYGPASARVCGQFQAEKGLRQDQVVGPATWDAAFTAPVT